MKKLIIIPILLLALLLIPVTASAASGIQVVSKIGDGNWTDDTWRVNIFPGETKSTNLTLYNPSSSSLDVWVNVTPEPSAEGNLTFNLSETFSAMTSRMTWDVVLSAIASGSATPGNYTAGIEIKSEVIIPPSNGGGGGGGAGSDCYLKIDMLGNITKVRMSCATDKTLKSVAASDLNNTNLLEIDYYTKVICDDTNEAPVELIMSLAESPPVPNGSVIIGSAYNFTSNYRTSTCGKPRYQCSGITFSKNITLILGYDSLPERIEDLAIAYYDNTDWVKLVSIVENNTVTAPINHIAFPTFAITGVIISPVLIFSVSSLSITPQQVAPNETVTISVNVSNTGDTEGNYTVVLEINGIKEADRTMSIAAGESQAVSFSVIREDAGVYSVNVNGLTGSFTVIPPLGFNVWLIICPIIAVITGVAVFLFIRSTRKGGEDEA